MIEYSLLAWIDAVTIFSRSSCLSRTEQPVWLAHDQLPSTVISSTIGTLWLQCVLSTNCNAVTCPGCPSTTSQTHGLLHQKGTRHRLILPYLDSTPTLLYPQLRILCPSFSLLVQAPGTLGITMTTMNIKDKMLAMHRSQKWKFKNMWYVPQSIQIWPLKSQKI